MAKLTSEEFIKKYSEKITDNDDLLIELMEDATDSIDAPADTSEVERLQAEKDKLQADYDDLKEKYKMRFLSSDDTAIEEKEEEASEEEPSEEEVIDIKEI